MLQVTFVMEQHIGHRAYYQNLRSFIDQVPGFSASWVEVTYHNERSLWHRLHFLPPSLRGTLIGRTQSRQGLKKTADVVFYNTQVPAVLSGKLSRERPYIIATDITPIQYDQMGKWYGHHPDRDGLLSRYKHRLNLLTLRNAAYLLPWSSWTHSSLVANYGIDPGRLEVLPPGVDLEFWRPTRRESSRLFRILFVGGDFHRKGGLLLLQMYQQLSRNFPSKHIELALVTRSQVPAMPGVRVYSDLTPNSPELIRLYQSSDVFVMPSLAEAFGIAAIEACAVGLPVIATRVGGLVDIVDDGCNGFLIEPEQAQALLDRVSVLVEDKTLREYMGEAGRNRAEHLFNASRNAARVVQIIQSMIQKGQQHVPR